MLQEVSPSDSTRMFSPPGSSRMAIPQGSTRIASPPDSTRMFRPAGSEAITIHNLDVENNRGWGRSYQFADALCICQDEQKRVMVDLWNYTEVGTGRMVSMDALCIVQD